MLTATLLGQQKLSVNSQGPMPVKTASSPAVHECAEFSAANDANATLVMKDENGVSVYSRQISVQRFRYYTNDPREAKSYQGGVFPASSAVVTFKYPLTSATKRAVQLELKTDDGTFKQVAKLQVTKPIVTPIKTHLIGQK